jgi:hypothetical protein
MSAYAVQGRRHRFSHVVILVAALAASACTKGNAMAKMVLFSTVEGTVTLADKPVVGAVIEREFDWAWKSEKGRDSVTTDAAGGFSMPPIVRSSFLGSLLPHEPVIRQSITIKANGKAYEAWLYNKHNYDDKGELAGKPMKLVCRLETEPKRRGDGIYGICEFE